MLNIQVTMRDLLAPFSLPHLQQETGFCRWRSVIITNWSRDKWIVSDAAGSYYTVLFFIIPHLSIVFKYSFSADNTRLYAEKTSENAENYVNNVGSCKICSRYLSRPVLYRGLSYQMMIYTDLMPVFLVKIPPALLTRFPESLVPPRSGSFKGKKMSDYIFHLKDLRMRKCRRKTAANSAFSRHRVRAEPRASRGNGVGPEANGFSSKLNK